MSVHIVVYSQSRLYQNRALISKDASEVRREVVHQAVAEVDDMERLLVLAAFVHLRSAT